MHGVISLLHETYYEQVEELWLEIGSRFGLQGMSRTPFPHFSYHISTNYDVPMLERSLPALAAKTAVFSITVSGLGIFTGANPVLYLPVVRTAELSQWQQQIWSAVEPVSNGTLAYYAPANWVPHITLSQHDLTPDVLPSVVKWLNQQNLYWQMPIDNLGLIIETAGKQDLYGRYPLTAR
jgi:2'-5' RNA ligase